jgi:ankyrin repeat protein
MYMYSTFALFNLQLHYHIYVPRSLSPTTLQDGVTALAFAAMWGEVEAVELLLSKGANIEAADRVIIFKELIHI